MLRWLESQKFRQRIELVELTKILERIPCDSISFTHKLNADILPYSAVIKCEVSAWIQRTEWGVIQPDIEIDPYDTSIFNWDFEKANSIYISPIQTANTLDFNYIIARKKTAVDAWIYPTSIELTGTSIHENLDTTTFLAKDENGNYQYGVNYTGYTAYRKLNNDYSKITVNISTAGIKTFAYQFYFQASNTQGIVDDYYLRLTYHIEVKESSIQAKPIPSISDVIERILDEGSTSYFRYYGTGYDSRFILDDNIKQKFANINAPEFFLPRMTMFEALLEVGKYIHAIPRLTVDANEDPKIITYDLLGLDEEYTLPNDAMVIGYKNLQSADDYCGAIDSYVENFINTIDPAAGSITEPFDGGYKTLRAGESGSITITNDTAVFEATYPIYRVIKFEMGFIDGELFPIGDITKYVYEASEYAGLFTTDKATYPNSVAYALKYTQGSRYITGFNTTSAALLSLIQSFKKESIANIVKLKSDGSITMESTQYYGNLAFRLTYIPMVNVRVKQIKPYIKRYGDNNYISNTLYNNQNANTVECNFYGESLKGKICRLGNEIEIYKVRFKQLEDLPKIGNLFNELDGSWADTDYYPEKYIYKITHKRAQNFIEADIYLTKDFNRLSQYFGLNSNFRLFEVSERQSIDRQVNISRLIKISNSTEYADHIYSISMTNYRGLYRFACTFLQREFNSLPSEDYSDPRGTKKISMAIMRLLGDERTGYATIGGRSFLKPVNSSAVGNSLLFTCNFEDNYSAGNRSTPAFIDNVSIKQQRACPYGDNYGEFYGLDVELYDRLYLTDGIYYPSSEDQQYNGIEDNLPIAPDNLSGDSLFETAGDYPVIGKNSSEVISLNFQFHGVIVEDETVPIHRRPPRIVMGSALWQRNGLIKEFDENINDAKTPHLFVLPNRLSQLRNVIDLSTAIDLGAISESNLSFDVDNSRVTLSGLTISNVVGLYKAWCIADKDTGEFFIGQNGTFRTNQNIDPIYFTFDFPLEYQA